MHTLSCHGSVLSTGPRSGCSRDLRNLPLRHPSRIHRPRHLLQVVRSAKVAPDQLLHEAIKAAEKGAEVVLDSASKPRAFQRKEGNDIVTETDRAAEAVVVASLRAAFPDHAVLGEEGGVTGPTGSDYLWCIDPLDGTVNFGSGYPSFCVSVGVLRHATPMAGCVIEFIGGGPGGLGGWQRRKYSACRNGGAFLDGQRLAVSRTRHLRDALLATEAQYCEEQWEQVAGLYRQSTQLARGVRMCGAAAANCCHLAAGVVDAYWQFNLKPWDVAAGAVILEEAGGRLATADGTAWSVFDRSLVATNDALLEQVLAMTEPAAAAMRESGANLGPWCIPPGYRVKAGAQLE
ncbi:hypothetical protein V8C86DRAFT_3133168 [Haematococcus lacustris]